MLLQFNRFTRYVGLASLGVVAIYPFMKRITYWPQIVLGLAFSWGALMGWPATFAQLDPPAFLLYAGAIAWVIGYDTIYAHQDREDDALIGIKSTALLFRERTKPMLALFYALAVALIALAGCSAGAGLIFALGLLAFAPHLAWQIARLDVDDPDQLPGGVQIEPRCRADPVRGAGAGCGGRARDLRGSITRETRCLLHGAGAYARRSSTCRTVVGRVVSAAKRNGKAKGSSRSSRLDPAEYPCRLLLDASNLSYCLPDIRRLVAWVPRSSRKVSANMPQTRRNPLNVPG